MTDITKRALTRGCKTTLLLLTCLFILSSSLRAQKQGQAKIDSVWAEQQSGHSKVLENNLKALEISEKLNDNSGIVKNADNIADAYLAQGDYLKALEYHLKALDINKRLNNKKAVAGDLISLGSICYAQGNYSRALEYFLNSLRVNEELRNKNGIVNSTNNIGGVYYAQVDYPRALKYYLWALKISEEMGYKNAVTTYNIASCYREQKDYIKALEFFSKALKLNQEIENKSGIAANTSGIGSVYAARGDYPTALEYYFKALKINGELGNKNSVANNSDDIGSAYLQQGKLPEAEQYLTTALQMATAMGMLEEARISNENLSALYEKKSDYPKALSHYKHFVTLKDSLNNDEVKKKTLRLQMSYDFSKRVDSIKADREKKEMQLQKEIQLAALKAEYDKKQALAKTERERAQLVFQEELKQQQITADFRQQEAIAEEKHKKDALLTKAEDEKKQALAATALKRQKVVVGSSVVGAILMLIIAAFSFRAYRQRRAGTLVIAKEKERSDTLLRNILPEEIAAELKGGAAAVARQYDEVTILITDFVNFTQISEQLSAGVLVKELHHCFSAFDRIIEKNGLEKIKTIGDAYMAVCGLPKADPAHASKAVKAALEIRDFIEARKKKERTFEIRIGVHSGPVVAGIVGIKKFAYDIWGDAVNIATEMEQQGEAGRVNISQSTYEGVKHEYACTPRSSVSTIKGQVQMYLVEAYDVGTIIAESSNQGVTAS
jgi:class 3 adenylate cyclase